MLLLVIFVIYRFFVWQFYVIVAAIYNFVIILHCIAVILWPICEAFGCHVHYYLMDFWGYFVIFSRCGHFAPHLTCFISFSGQFISLCHQFQSHFHHFAASLHHYMIVQSVRVIAYFG